MVERYKGELLYSHIYIKCSRDHFTSSDVELLKCQTNL